MRSFGSEPWPICISQEISAHQGTTRQFVPQWRQNTEYRSRREGLSWSCVHCLSPHVCWALQVARPGHYPRAHSHCSFNRRQQEQRSEEHTSELQSRLHLVCRLLLEKKKKK